MAKRQREPTIPEGRARATQVTGKDLARALWLYAEEYSQFDGPVQLGPRVSIAHRLDHNWAEPTVHDREIPFGYHLLTRDGQGRVLRETDTELEAATERLANYLDDQLQGRESGRTAETEQGRSSGTHVHYPDRATDHCEPGPGTLRNETEGESPC